MINREASIGDMAILIFDKGLRTLATRAVSERPYPAEKLGDVHLSENARQQVAGLMRVNHSGEICAQGLYHGQSVCARDPEVRLAMQRASLEEQDHIAWCETRLNELNSAPSLLNPMWYVGSWLLGFLAGACSDTASLGFVAETEKQVVMHLQKHLNLLPEKDLRTRAILDQMQNDEAHHQCEALDLGGMKLPFPFPTLMTLTSTIMTTLSFYL